jgi:hypothetical protein
MINKYEAGITRAKIAEEYGLNEPTVRHILDRVLYEYKREEIPPDNSTPTFIQERIIVCTYSLYTGCFTTLGHNCRT